MGFRDWINDPGNSAWLGTLGESISDGRLENFGRGLHAANARRASVYQAQEQERLRQEQLARQEEMQRRQDEQYQRSVEEQQAAEARRRELGQIQSRQLESAVEAGLIEKATPQYERALFMVGTEQFDGYIDGMREKSVSAKEAEDFGQLYHGAVSRLEESGAIDPATAALFRQNNDPKEQRAILNAFSTGVVRDSFEARDDKRDQSHELAKIQARNAASLEQIEARGKPDAGGPDPTDVDRIRKALAGLPQVGSPKKGANPYLKPDENPEMFWSAEEVERQKAMIRFMGPEIYDAMVGEGPPPAPMPEPPAGLAGPGPPPAAMPQPVPSQIRSGVDSMRAAGASDDQIMAAMREAGVPEPLIAAALR